MYSIIRTTHLDVLNLEHYIIRLALAIRHINTLLGIDIISVRFLAFGRPIIVVFIIQ